MLIETLRLKPIKSNLSQGTIGYKMVKGKIYNKKYIMHLVCALKGSDLLVFWFMITKIPLTVIKTSSLSASFRTSSTVKDELPKCTNRECSFMGNTILALWLKVREIFIE